ncbi:hypothetical protein P175DRAFT_0476905 [Aspergillus ochraceoroseus IBT 24754]|uniref:NAD-dependent epimerase/dehydratase domain-containing protein n=3 Tax=Aspergillus subgen. Nidulantes TaxID=2720870 RepID=A0A0F8WT22_9EURO|nr:uncharacterized protein P175DRAFT_0476905 [Aspergillus ochraceoroseus IBT 24754]KKK14397.1 hypothetical protein ARAM_000104 [Aspergillus rambellii]KKK25585.1 hypothetical protein AOCH_000082 [Aspergillus ochraceoroseus]PTU21591.1 hypothetical protein P175DRAFT_0476905 [Aspergillus ochraceoroseus IBT 24754]
MAATKLLLTGATGYIGGTVLTQLLKSTVPEIKQLSVSVLVRKREQAERYESEDVTPVIFNGLEDTEQIRSLASGYDIILHAADSTNSSAAEALILGLADNQDRSKNRYFIHTSGTSSLGDRPITGPSAKPRDHSDKEDIYSCLKALESLEPYAQRATDIKIVETGDQAGIDTLVIKAPIIYGRGTGYFHEKSFHIPLFIKGAVAAGHAEYIGDGCGVWDYVHVVELGKFFEFLLTRVLRGESVPSGHQGIYFIGSLRYSWKELSEGIATAGSTLGLLTSAEAQSISLKEAAEKYTRGNESLAEVGLASNSLTRADLAREMGWVSNMTDIDFQKSLLDDFDLLCRHAE